MNMIMSEFITKKAKANIEKNLSELVEETNSLRNQVDLLLAEKKLYEEMCADGRMGEDAKILRKINSENKILNELCENFGLTREEYEDFWRWMRGHWIPKPHEQRCGTGFFCETPEHQLKNFSVNYTEIGSEKIVTCSCGATHTIKEMN